MGRGKCNQNILYGKNMFPIKEKNKVERHREKCEVWQGRECEQS